MLSRSSEINRIIAAIANEHIRIVHLYWARGSWKTHILNTLMQEKSIRQQKFFLSFEHDIVAKQFHTVHDVMTYISLNTGINRSLPSVLFINEVQYSKNLIALIYEMINMPDIQTCFLLTGITPINDYHYDDRVARIMVHPLTFFDYLENKNIHTTYLHVNTYSPIMMQEIIHYRDEYLTWWWYPSVITASSAEHKIHELKNIVQKIYDKDIGFRFNHDEVLVFETIMNDICQQSWSPYKHIPTAKRLSITSRLLLKYKKFLHDQYLINTIPYFCQDKKSELSHQETLYVTDNGLISYMGKNFWSKIHDMTSIKTFVYNEVLKHMDQTDKLHSYQKVNMSSIDFLIIHADESITPIIVSERNSPAIPKIYHSFADKYGSRVRRYVKTTLSSYSKGTHKDTDYICLPHALIGDLTGR